MKNRIETKLVTFGNNTKKRAAKSVLENGKLEFRGILPKWSIFFPEKHKR